MEEKVTHTPPHMLDEIADLGLDSIQSVFEAIDITSQELEQLNIQLAGKSNRKLKKLEDELEKLNLIKEKYVTWKLTKDNTPVLTDNLEATNLRKKFDQLKEILLAVDFETFEELIIYFIDGCQKLKTLKESGHSKSKKAIELENEITMLNKYVCDNKEFVISALKHLESLKEYNSASDSDGTGSFQIVELTELCDGVLGRNIAGLLADSEKTELEMSTEQVILNDTDNCGDLEESAQPLCVSPPTQNPTFLNPRPSPQQDPADAQLQTPQPDQYPTYLVGPSNSEHQSTRPVPKHPITAPLLETNNPLPEEVTNYLNLPEVAEKSVLILCSYFQQLNQKHKVTPLLLNSPAHAQVWEVYNTLKTQLSADDDVFHGIVKDKLKEVEQMLSKNVDISSIRQIRRNLNTILREIRPLDMDLMLHLLRDARYATDQIAGKDIILLLGPSGSGKSLTVHFFAGSKIEKHKSSLIPASIKPGLEPFVSSDSTHSVTRSINSFAVDLCSVLPTSGLQSVIVCDTPGFGDTDGAEYDIANGIGIANAIRLCKSIKPVILLSYPGLGDRAEGVSKMSRVLVKMFQSIESHLPSFTYLFTKFQKDQEDLIIEILEKVEEELTDEARTDACFVALLKDMAKQGYEHGIFILDPVYDSPATYLSHILQKPALANPKDVVQNFVSPKSLDLLKNQLLKDSTRLKAALDQVDVGNLRYKLNQLRQFNKYVSIQESENALESAIGGVKKIIQQCMEQFDSSCSKIIFDTNIDFEGDVQMLHRNSIKLLNLEQLRLDDEALKNDFPNLFEYVLTRGKKLSLILKEKCENFFELDNTQEHTCKDLPLPMFLLVGTILNKLFAVCEISVDQSSTNLAAIKSMLSQHYSWTCDSMQLKLSAVYAKAELLTSKFETEEVEPSQSIPEKLDAFIFHVDFIQQANSSPIGNHVDAEKNSKFLFEIKNNFVHIVETRASEASTALRRVIENPVAPSHVDDASLIIKTIEFLTFIVSHKSFGKYVLCDSIATHQQKLLNDTSCYITQLQEGLAEKLSKKLIDSSIIYFSEVETCLFIAETFFENSRIQHEQQSMYLQIIEAINNLLASFERSLLQQLSFKHQLEISSLQEFKTTWDNLKSASLLLSKFPNISSSKNEVVLEEARLASEKFETFLTNNPPMISSKPSSLLSLFEQMEWLVKAFDCLEVSTLQVQTIFIEKAQDQLKIIVNEFSSDCNDYEHLYHCFIYFILIKKFSFNGLSEQIESLETAPTNLLERFKNNFIEEILQDFQLLLTLEENEEAAAVVERLSNKLSALKFIRKLYNVDITLPDNLESKIFVDMFQNQPCEILVAWSGESGYLSKHLDSLLKKAESAVASTGIQEMKALLVQSIHCFPFDSFLPEFGDAVKKVRNFRDLASFLENQIQKYAEGVISNLKISISLGKFEEFSVLASSYDSSAHPSASADFCQIQKEVQSKISKLLLDAGKFIDSNLSKSKLLADSMRQLFGQMSMLMQAEKYALVFLPETEAKSLQSKFDTTKTNLRRLIVNFLSYVDQDLATNNFSKAEERMQMLENLAEEAANITVPQLDESPTSSLLSCKDFILEGIKNKKGTLKGHLESSVERYHKLGLSEYHANPPSKLFDAFRDALAYNDINYKHAYDKLAELIASEIKLFLIVDTSIEGGCSPDEIEVNVALIESVSKYLPVDVIGKYDETLQSTKKSIQDAKDASEREQELLIASGKFSELIDKLEEYSKEKRINNLIRCKERILNNITQSCKNLQTDLKKGDLVAVLRTFPMYWSDWMYYSNKLSYLKKQAEEAWGWELRLTGYAHEFGKSKSLDKNKKDYSSDYGYGHKDKKDYGTDSGYGHKDKKDYSSDYGYSHKVYRTGAHAGVGVLGRVKGFLGGYDLDFLFSDPDALHKCSSIIDEVTKHVSQSLMFVLSIPEGSLEAMKNLAKDFPKIVAFVQSSYNQKCDASREFSSAVKKKDPEMETKLVQALQHSAACFIAHQKLFETGLENKNISQVAQIMDATQDLEAMNLYSTLEAYVETEFCAHFTPDIHEFAQKCLLYKNMRNALGKQVLEWKSTVKKHFQTDDPRTVSPIATERDEFYVDLSQSFHQLMHIKRFPGHIDASTLDLGKIEEECRNHFRDQISTLEKTLEDLLLNIPSQDMSVYCQEFNKWHGNLRSIFGNFDDTSVSTAAKTAQDTIDRKFKLKLHEMEDSAFAVISDSDTDQCSKDLLGNFVDELIKIKSISSQIPNYKKDVNAAIDKIMNDIKSLKNGVILISQICLILNAHENSAISHELISDTNVFQGYALELRNKKTLTFTVDHVLGLTEDYRGSKECPLKGDDINPDLLKYHYNLFDQEYWKLVEKGLIRAETEVVLKDLVYKAKTIPRESGEMYQTTARKLMACVFAYWTLDHYQKSAILSEESSSKNYLLQPHAAQVIGIFRLLGIENDECTLHKDFCESDAKRLPVPVETSLPPSPPPPEKGLFLKEEHNFKADDSTDALLTTHNSTGIEKSLDSSGLLVDTDMVEMPVDKTCSNSLLKPLPISLPNHLVEILTGEGKSVTLAVTACVLALLGFDVSCACYSEYLSKRDYDSFQPVFKAFDIHEHISYGTFNRLCEDFINLQGDVRDIVAAIISGGQHPKQIKTLSGRPAALLIDEVDVFFNKDFYGNVYRPLLSLKHKSISSLIRHIWNTRSQPTERTFTAIKSSAVYISCLEFLSGWAELLEECVKTMLNDLNTYESQEYVVEHDKIGYKDQDTISYNISYGYKTLFAYFKEWEDGNITPSTLESKTALLISCGNFSYAEIPKCYAFVMGVTGTLNTLSPPEKKLLEDAYDIRRKTFVPSVYGKNQLNFTADSTTDCIIDSRASFHINLTNEIKYRLQSISTNNYQRAVLVFFETTKKLKEFLNSEPMKLIKSEQKVRILTEQTFPVDREGIIAYAVNSGGITLLGREFGRGTDFICHDDRLIQSGGIHVIQTFVSEEISEETQIKGRTARQGNKGSFSMVLIDTELEKYGISLAEINEMKSTGKLYSRINQKRCQFFEASYPENMRYVDEIKEDHNKSTCFLDQIMAHKQGSENHVKSFLLRQNKAPAGGVFRTLILMDATGSMSGVITKSKHTVKTMFERMHSVIEAKGGTATLEIQFACYRNYDCSLEMLLQVSPWETNPDNLRKFMDSISAYGGTHWEEAIEIALFHAVSEHDARPIDQVILIGDAAPNTREQVAAGRARAPYLVQSRFKVPTFYTEQLAELRKRGIPVHAYFVYPSARESFRGISSLAAPGGRSEELLINSPQGHEQLTNLIAEEILRKVGGDELVSDYRHMFAKGYL